MKTGFIYLLIIYFAIFVSKYILKYKFLSTLSTSKL